MKKIYFLQTHLVKLEDAIEYNGIKGKVIKELIELNPELFVVKDTMQELLDKAKRDYPVGTVFRSFFGVMCTVKNRPRYSLGAYDSILIDDTYVYRDGRWAEILPLKFITEDGVSIYGDMKTYAICRDELILELPSVYGGNSPTLIYFYHKENALAYIEKHKEKTLRDYENSLSLSMWGWFKIYEPKLYYTKVLQLIADDLNDGWVADFNSVIDKKYHISYNRIDFVWTLNAQGIIVFKSEELAEKARDILGDKLEYLFN